MVDINVHPRKSEVKFEDDKIIFKAVYHAILNALNNPLHERYERESSSYVQPVETEAKCSGYDLYQSPQVVSDHSDTAEHIATAIDYDKVFGGRRTKGV